MPIARKPHSLFATVWALWIVAVFVALGNPERPLLGMVVLLAFFAVEIPATVLRMPGNARDTLSEVMTWVQRHMSKHRRFARGWNAVLLAIIVAIAWLLMRTVAHYSDSVMLGWLLGTLLAVFLWDHFMSPDQHG